MFTYWLEKVEADDSYFHGDVIESRKDSQEDIDKALDECRHFLETEDIGWACDYCDTCLDNTEAEDYYLIDGERLCEDCAREIVDIRGLYWLKQTLKRRTA